MTYGKDPLGIMYVKNEFEQRKNEENIGQHIRRLRSSLSKYVLQLRSTEAKQTSLGLILESLRVCYAREALVQILSEVVGNADERGRVNIEDGGKAVQASKSNAESRSSFVKDEKKEKERSGAVLSLTKIKLLVSLLKLGFAGRLNEKQRENLLKILVQMAEKDKEVNCPPLFSFSTSSELRRRFCVQFHSFVVFRSYGS